MALVVVFVEIPNGAAFDGLLDVAKEKADLASVATVDCVEAGVPDF